MDGAADGAVGGAVGAIEGGTEAAVVEEAKDVELEGAVGAEVVGAVEGGVGAGVSCVEVTLSVGTVEVGVRELGCARGAGL